MSIRFDRDIQMSNRISSISVRTTLKFEDNKEILFALRNVLDVVETEFGYLVVLEEPMKSDYVEATIKAIASFEFVEDVANVTPHDFGIFTTDVKGRIFDAIAKEAPKLENFGDDVGEFAIQHRAWLQAQRKIYDALYGK
jgi:hypothetical protein